MTSGQRMDQTYSTALQFLGPAWGFLLDDSVYCSNASFICVNQVEMVDCVCSLLYQVQQVLGHLLESKLQYYVPERFWQVFHLWGNTPVNIREQQDALDFFQAFIDQVDEQIKVIIRYMQQTLFRTGATYTRKGTLLTVITDVHGTPIYLYLLQSIASSLFN